MSSTFNFHSHGRVWWKPDRSRSVTDVIVSSFVCKMLMHSAVRRRWFWKHQGKIPLVKWCLAGFWDCWQKLAESFLPLICPLAISCFATQIISNPGGHMLPRNTIRAKWCHPSWASKGSATAGGTKTLHSRSCLGNIGNAKQCKNNAKH